MSLEIKQETPKTGTSLDNNTPSSKTTSSSKTNPASATSKSSTNNSVAKSGGKIDICSGISLPSMSTNFNMTDYNFSKFKLKYPNIDTSLPSFSLPSFKVLDGIDRSIGSSAFSKISATVGNGFNFSSDPSSYGDWLSDSSGDWLPNFTKLKIKGLKLRGMDNPFSCSLRNSLNPGSLSMPSLGNGSSSGLKIPKFNLKDIGGVKLGNLKHKQSVHELDKIGCNDSDANLKSPTITGKVLETAVKSDNCSKKIADATKDVADDLNKLDLNSLTSSKNSIAKSMLKATMDGKFDVATASKILNDDATVKTLTEITKSGDTPLERALKVSKAAGLTDGKEDIVEYATKISDPKDIASVAQNDVMDLSKKAVLDNVADLDTVPGTPIKITTSQKLQLMSKVNNTGGSGGFGGLGGMSKLAIA